MQTLFADDTYSKPYFVTYIDTSCFIGPLIPVLLRKAYRDPQALQKCLGILQNSVRQRYRAVELDEESDVKPGHPGLYSRSPELPSSESQELLLHQNQSSDMLPHGHITEKDPEGPVTFATTARLSLEFCFLWFLANYFVAGCLEYTTVASSTVLTSTSSIFTLLFGVLFRVESFTMRKTFGVMASLAGIALISTVDLSGESDENRGRFPHKSISEIALGDVMALVSAVLYGIYAVFMKKRIGDESRVEMPLFFGLVGLYNVLLLWPGFFVLHYTGVETFEMPPTGKVWAIILVCFPFHHAFTPAHSTDCRQKINAISSVIADYAWAYAVLLTSPTLVTVGLSMTIPLSLIGQIILNDQKASFVYWIGAIVVLLSFVIVNHESKTSDVSPPPALPEGDQDLCITLRE